MSDFATRYGSVALVAGAAEGLGAAYARELAARGLDLVLLDLNREGLADLARELSDEVHVTTRVVDLATPDLLDEVAPLLDEHDVGCAVLNVAFSRVGDFLGQSPQDVARMVDVNARAIVLLAHAAATRMAERGRGGLLFMSSLSALQGTPLVATYAATKAFDLTLADALGDELRERGVHVTTCLGGPIDTPGFRSSEPRGGPSPMDPADVARAALDALGSRSIVVPGGSNRLSAAAMQLLPRRLATRVMGTAMRRMYRHEE